MTAGSYPPWIMERAPGGPDVAASPGGGKGIASSKWPEGPTAPVAKEASDLLLSACRTGLRSRSTILFLVGGAGNGKSWLAKKLVEASGAKLRGATGRFASRAYDFDLKSGGALRVINDATIPAGDGNADLGADVASMLEDGCHGIACVNRGVIVGEARRYPGTTGTGSETAARAIVAWLIRGDEVFGPGEAVRVGDWRVDVVPPVSAAMSHYSFARLHGPGCAVADIHVVYMDHASLLEAAPDPARVHGPQESLEPSPLTCTPIGVGGRRNAAFLRPLTEVARRFLDYAPTEWPGGDLDPVKANATALLDDAVADGWCRVMRAAEVHGGMHLTYRDLWALATVSITGGAPLEVLQTWIADRAAELVRAGDDADARLAPLAALANARTPILLFGALPAENPRNAPGWPGARATTEALNGVQAVDPLRDFAPPDAAVGEASVVDALAAIEEGDLPARGLASKLAGRGMPGLQCAWSLLDEALENTVARCVDPSRQDGVPDRSAVLAWYGQYLVRLVALSSGWPAFRNVVDDWQAAMRRGLDGDQLPQEMAGSLREVVLPSRELAGGRRTLLPLLRSRVIPVSPDDPHVAIRVDPLEFRVELRVEGSGLVVSIGRPGADADRAETALDFHLLREATARRGGTGFTDSIREVEPRIERLRARLVAIDTGREARGESTADVVFAGREIVERG